jgi:cell division transport system permease protein
VNRPRSSRRGSGPAVSDLLVTWLASHARALLYSTGQFSRNPFVSLLALAVIGITLALPAGLFALLANAAQVSVGWESSAQISAFLHMDVNEPRAQTLATEIEQRSDVARVTLITRGAALAEYRRLSGFSDALAVLKDNPLPHLLIVKPSGAELTPNAVEALRTQLANRDEVEVAQFDLDWVLRLDALTELVRQAVGVLTALLAVAVSLIIGNTIRMNVFSRLDEIEIARLFGATNSFVRRPFLYSGMMFGAGGGLLGVALVNGCFAVLESPIRTLAAVYSSDFVFSGLGLSSGIMLVAIGGILGFIGSWLAVGRYLSTDHTPA